ncbi:MAG TPA: cytochrome c oxidase subunit 3 [Fimbriimonadaceae bacterium]|nr:cytochrome c oxidase subunit 3 [Fimbriimonadaceae bacterium]HRJ33541.1 cytochrome c oxidase subunit 3 [Fimbriimonadaceae bacterium]
MATEAAHGHDQQWLVHHQYEDYEQQSESYIVGMWAFLVTEIMFFGALFLAYVLYRWQYQPEFYLIHKDLDWVMGGINTTVLLFSSLAVALAVRCAMLQDRKGVLGWLTVTQLCAAGFLVIKYFEWSHKYHKGVWLGEGFKWGEGVTKYAQDVSANTAQLFYSLYYCMTGLHGFHVVIGIIVIGILMRMWFKNNPLVTKDYVPTELVGLYWHFVDLVWIFLYPLFYLMPR